MQPVGVVQRAGVLQRARAAELLPVAVRVQTTVEVRPVEHFSVGELRFSVMVQKGLRIEDAHDPAQVQKKEGVRRHS